MNEREGSLEHQHDDKIEIFFCIAFVFFEILPFGGKQIGNISEEEWRVGLNIR